MNARIVWPVAWVAALALPASLGALGEFGPPASPKPLHGLLGEVLPELGRAPEAVTALRGALSLTPGRTSSPAGLLRASEASGDEATAAAARGRSAANTGTLGRWEVAFGACGEPRIDYLHRVLGDPSYRSGRR